MGNRCESCQKFVGLEAAEPELNFFDAAIATYENRFFRRFWTTQETYVEAWVEKDALSQVLAGAVEGLNTIVAPSRGYSSYSYIKQALARFQNNHDDADQVIILYLGDHDPSGLDMTRDLQRRFNDYGQGNVELKRVALNFDQVRQFNLLPAPTKIQDSRAAGYIAEYGNDCWELDALDPDELVRLVSEAVENEITDWDAWDEIKERDERERGEIQLTIEDLKKKYRE